MIVAWLRNLLSLVRSENLGRLALVVAVLVLIGSITLSLIEPKTDFSDALWLTLVTMTTVGYGDITPSTLAGRAIGVVLMLAGIGVLGMLSATIASILVAEKLKEDRGMQSFSVSNHFILCGWNHRARNVWAEMRVDERNAETPVVLIAELEGKPEDDRHLHFIRGDVTEETLQRANLEEASTVVIFGDDRLDSHARDARVVLATLTVETINPNAYTIVELSDHRNSRHCQRARADEIIVPNELGSRLISSAARDHGISKVIYEVLSSDQGNDLYKIALPQELQGQAFLDVFTEMKRSREATLLAVQKGDQGEVISNPPADLRVERGDHLILISKSPA